MTSFSKARSLVVSAAVGVAALSTVARADTLLFDSLHSENAGTVGTPNVLPTFAASFETGDSAVRVSDVALLLNQSFFVPGDTFTVSLMGGVPLADVEFIPNVGLNVQPNFGTVLGSVTLPISNLPTDLTVEHFSQLDGIALQPNSFYWISLNLSDFDASVGWGVTNDDSGPGVAEAYNSSEITDFTFFPNAPTPPPNNGGPIFQMEVSASAVPEPATWALMLIGLAGLGLAYRHRGSALRLA